MNLRPEVQRFAEAMEIQLRANDHKHGWKNDTPQELLQRLIEETDELREECKGPPVRWIPFFILKEAVDVANFAMMISDVCGGLSIDPEAWPVGEESWKNQTNKMEPNDDL